MQLLPIFHLGHPTDYNFYPILGFVLLLQLKQPVEVINTFFLRMLSPFSRLFFSFSDDVTIIVPWACTFWGYLRMSLVPSCPSEMLAVLLKNASGPQAHSSQAGWQFLSEFWQTSVEYLVPFNQVTFMAAHITCLLFDFISSHAVFIVNLYSW